MKITLSEIKRMVREEIIEEKRKRDTSANAAGNNIKNMLNMHNKRKDVNKLSAIDYENIETIINLYLETIADERLMSVTSTGGEVKTNRLTQLLNRLKNEIHTSIQTDEAAEARLEAGRPASQFESRKKRMFF